ncbi:hypothetical protein O9929_00360 [Vibrio lentus]|nr:hypothetical protein [Vibrio lentus]
MPFVYTPVVNQKKAVWSPIYANADERQEITLSALAPIYDNDEFKAAIVSDIKINTFNAFLRDLKIIPMPCLHHRSATTFSRFHSEGGSVVSWEQVNPQGPTSPRNRKF